MNNRQKWPYPLRGFLWGLVIGVVAALVVLVLVQGPEETFGHFSLVNLLEAATLLLAFGAGAGLVGMFVGAIISDRQTWPYLWRGFLIGLSIGVILTIASAPLIYWIQARRDYTVGSLDLAVIETVFFIIILGPAIAVGTGLIGTLIGYVMYRKKRGRKQPGPPKCGKCGYSLVGLTCDKCPECGHTVRSTAPS